MSTPQLPIIQLIQFPDRIINPSAIRRAGWIKSGHPSGNDFLQIVFKGGHVHNINDANASDQVWENLRHGPFLQHAQWLYNPEDIAQVVVDSPKEVSVFFITGDYIIVSDDASGFYGKWITYKNQNDAIIAAAIAQQQARVIPSGAMPAPSTTDFMRKLRGGN